MPWDVTCPVCQRTFPVSETRQPIGIACPKCDAELTAEFREFPGESTPQARVTVGYPPSASAYAALANQHESDSAKRRKLRYKPASMAGVMLAGLGTLLLSVGGLGAAGYVLFTNLDGSDSVAQRGTNRTPDPTPPSPIAPNPIAPPDPLVLPPVKPHKFDLRPIAGVLPAFKAPNMTADPMVFDLAPLGGRVGAITVAGGGRYLVFHYPDRGIISGFDICEARLLGGVGGVERGDVKLAAGLSWAVLAAPQGQKTMLRVFDLPRATPTLQQRFDTSIEMQGGVSAIAMGNRTEGPLLALSHQREVALFDLFGNTFKEVEGSRKMPGVHTQNLRAAPDGYAFVTFDNVYSFDGHPETRTVHLLAESNRDWLVSTLPPANRPPPLSSFQRMIPSIPGGDGNFYGSSAVFTRDGQVAGVLGEPIPLNPDRLWYVPALTNSLYFLRVASVRLPSPLGALVPLLPVGVTSSMLRTLANAGGLPGVFQVRTSLQVLVHPRGNASVVQPNTPVLTGLPEFDGLVDANGVIKPVLDQHFFLVPEAKVLVTLSGDRTKLTVRRLNLP